VVPLAQPKPYLPQKPAAPSGPKHVTGSPERFVTCPACKRRFSVHPDAEVLECPHCGKKGKAAPKKPHITSPQPPSKSIRCPRCGNAIVYNEGQQTIRCGKCGKEGKVKKKV
jgi:ribosomal protein S27E